jgi:hypothetical protein
MNQDLSARLAVFAICALLVITGACSRTQTPRFYTLSSLTDPQTGRRAAAEGDGITVGLGPIRMPDYLDRPQIVTRVGPNQVRFAEYHRWAQPLEGSFASVLMENLSILLGTNRIARYPWKSTTPIDCRIEIEVSRFDGRPGDRVFLQGRWTVFSQDRERVLVAKTSTLSEPVDGNGYAALVSAQSRAIAALGREIAEAVRMLSEEGEGK